MDAKKFITGTLAGGITFFFLGYLVYGLALSGFFSSHSVANSGSMKGMDDIVWWALIAGNLASAAMLTYIFQKWTTISSFGSGYMAAAAIGFFLALGMDLTRFATENLFDLTATLTDVVVGTVMNGIVGGVIGVVLGMGKKT